jgi:hypothetical protein
VILSASSSQYGPRCARVETNASRRFALVKNGKDLVPNSVEWLAALEHVNAHQAAITRAIVAKAGSEEVCAVCGDTPARDYDLPGISLRGRFCAECKVDQAAT